MSGSFGRREMTSPLGLSERYQERREAIESQRRRASVPDVLRGSLLDPNADRNLADDLAIESRERARLRARYGPLAFLRDILVMLGTLTASAIALSYGASLAYLPDLGVYAVPSEFAWLTGPAVNRATAIGFLTLAVVAMLSLGSQFGRRMRHGGFDGGRATVLFWVALVLCVGAAGTVAPMPGLLGFCAVPVVTVVAGLVVPGRI